MAAIRLVAPATVIGALLVGALGGCATLGPDGVVPDVPATERESGAVALDAIGEAALGALAELPPGNPLGVERVRVIEEYPAASGRRCRRVALPNDPRPALVCHHANGHWLHTRSLVDDASFAS